jgi:hypothetical protein
VEYIVFARSYLDAQSSLTAYERFLVWSAGNLPGEVSAWRTIVQDGSGTLCIIVVSESERIHEFDFGGEPFEIPEKQAMGFIQRRLEKKFEVANGGESKIRKSYPDMSGPRLTGGGIWKEEA